MTNETTLLFFNIVSLYFNTLFNWYINLTKDGTTYPSQHFPFGAAFVCQAGNFWTLLRVLYKPTFRPLSVCLSAFSNLRVGERPTKKLKVIFYQMFPIYEGPLFFFFPERFPCFTRLFFWYQQHADEDKHRTLLSMILTGSNQSTRRKTCHTVTPSITNLTCNDQGSKPSLRGARPATNRFGQGGQINEWMNQTPGSLRGIRYGRGNYWASSI